MRRICSVLLLVSFWASFLPLSASAEGSYYLVSAYYSPVEWQDFYLHGSYEAEIKMNGGGKTTASGQPVRIWVIAAPREMPYNTRVHINQSINIKGAPYKLDFHGTILDRGGAIHSAAKLPRLDIYMGKWQEGLCRAINFGVQTVFVNFDTDTSIPDTSSFDGISSSCNDPHTETVPLASGAKKEFDPFTMTIGAGSPAENIMAVQKLLSRVNSYTGPIDGKYNDALTDAIFEFQKANGIVQKRTDDGAGTYGPKTRAMLKALLTGVLNKTSTTKVTAAVTTTTEEDDTTDTPTPATTPDETDTPTTGGDARDLQTKLKDLGFFSFEIDGIYNKRLVDALYAFQLEKKIVTGVDDPGAGYYGPVTKTTIEEAYTNYLARKEKILALEKERESVIEHQKDVRAEKQAEFVAMMAKIPSVKLWQVHPEIRTLQKLLKELGFLSAKDTAIFGTLTKTALAKYQLQLKVIDSLSSQYAGVFGDKTRAAIALDLYNRWLTKDTTGVEEIKEVDAEISALKKG